MEIRVSYPRAVSGSRGSGSYPQLLSNRCTLRCRRSRATTSHGSAGITSSTAPESYALMRDCDSLPRLTGTCGI